MANNDWTELLDGVDFDAEERRDLQRFYDSPNGLNFFPVARILIERGAIDEAIEILQVGIGQNPKHIGAVCLLADLFMRQGAFEKAFDLTENYHMSASENLLLQIIRLKLAVVLGYNDLVDILVAGLRPFSDQDSELTLILSDLKCFGFDGLRSRILESIDKHGFDDIFSEISENTEIASHGASKLAGIKYEYRSAKGFFVAPLSQVFKARLEIEGDFRDGLHDSLSLVRIYKQQGYLHHALKMLERLISIAPENEALINESKDLCGLIGKRDTSDYATQKGISEDLASLVVIDNKLAYLNSILGSLELYE